jgi:hypothetical protein
VRFNRAVVAALAGTALQSGSTTTAPPNASCPGAAVQRDCTRQRRTVRGARATFASPRRGVLRLGRLQRASGIRSLAGGCGNEPADVRAIRTDLNLANGPLAAADVFALDVPRFFVSGNSEQVTTLEGPVEGRVTERVRWTLTFTRLTG